MLNHATNHTQQRCTQATEKPTASLSTFNFAPSSQN